MTGLVFGIAPALRGTGMNVSSSLKETSRSVVGGRSLLGKALLVVQVAISLVLLIGAGLFLQTLQNLRQVDVGFNPQNLLLFRVNPSLNRYDEKKTTALYHDLLERLASVPGVRGVALSNPALLSGSVNSTGIYVQGRVYSGGRRGELDNGINRLVISPSFFEVMGIPIVLGRGFTDRDNADGAEGRGDQRGGRAQVLPEPEPDRPDASARSLETTGQMEIVGVLHDVEVRQRPRRDAAHDVCAVPADPRRRRRVRGADRGRAGGRHGGGARGRPADRFQPAADGRVDADRTGRAAASRRRSSSPRPTRSSAAWRCSWRRSASSG